MAYFIFMLSDNIVMVQFEAELPSQLAIQCLFQTGFCMFNLEKVLSHKHSGEDIKLKVIEHSIVVISDS